MMQLIPSLCRLHFAQCFLSFVQLSRYVRDPSIDLVRNVRYSASSELANVLDFSNDSCQLFI